MQLLKNLRSSDFLRHNGVFFVGTLVVSVLNYLFYPILGRLMPTSQFGEVQTLVSLFLQINIFLGVLTNVAVNVVANESDVTKRNRIVTELERLATVVTIAAALIGLIFIGQARTFLRFNDNLPFIVLALSFVISAPLALQNAYLRGRSAFGRLSLNTIAGSAAKLVGAVVLVLAGLGTAGAIGGLVVAQLLALIMARSSARKLGLAAPKGTGWRLPDLAILRPQLPYTALVLVVSLVTTYLFSVDVIVIKHYFDPATAGVYAGIATIARIIYYLTGSVATVLLSTVRRDQPISVNRRLLARSAVLHLALGGAALLVFMAVPRLITNILIGSKYLPQASLLPRLSLALFVIATTNLVFSYDLALRRRSAAVVSIVGAAITFGLVLAYHGTPTQVVNSILVGGLCILGLRGLDTVRRYVWARQTA